MCQVLWNLQSLKASASDAAEVSRGSVDVHSSVLLFDRLFNLTVSWQLVKVCVGSSFDFNFIRKKIFIILIFCIRVLYKAVTQ